MKRFLMIISLILAANFAQALDLQEARSKGLLLEQPNGFVKVAKPSADVNALAAEVNARRKAEYEKISKENGQPVDVVAKLAAEQIAKRISGN